MEDIVPTKQSSWTEVMPEKTTINPGYMLADIINSGKIDVNDPNFSEEGLINMLGNALQDPNFKNFMQRAIMITVCTLLRTES